MIFAKSNSPLVVVKVGGSLFDLPDLGVRLNAWLAEMSPARVLLVPGGGPLVDMIRAFTRQHRLDEDTAHWLAVRAMSLTARLLQALLAPGARMVTTGEEAPLLWRQDIVPVIDVCDFLERDEGNPGCLPHSWSVTSDSIAARLALVCGADELVLLKSITIPEGMSWSHAAEEGFVDEHFARLADCGLKIRAINFRRGSARQDSS